MAGPKPKREVIDLTGSDDESYISDDDVVLLQSPPRNMRKFNNANAPIDVDGDEEAGIFQRYTPEENEWRRMLMMDHDLLEEGRPKRKGEESEKGEEGREGYKRIRSRRRRRPEPPVASTSGPTALLVAQNRAGPSKQVTFDLNPALVGPVASNSVHLTAISPSGSAGPPDHVALEAPNNPGEPLVDPLTITPETPSLDTLIAQLLAIIPDMCPDHASKELQFLLATRQHNNAIETVVTKAFEDGYPKFTKQVPAVEQGVEEKYAGQEYRAEKRRGLCYQALSNVALEEAFPFVPIPYIRALQNQHSFLFGPTYLQLVADDLQVVKPFTILKRPRPAGKGKNAMPDMDEGGVEFELEKNWILAHAAAMRVKRDAEIAKKLADEAEWAAGGAVECGCCYGEYLPDGHLYCGECCTQQTETKLGEEIHIILCMDTSGCEARFDEKELARLLPPKSLELLQRLRFAQELEDAAIEGLESCPHCPWAVVIDNPDEKLFRCQNEACGKVSCRQCKQAEHLPKSCEEIAASRKADKRHAVEDAMSEALIRKCPKCAKPYIKDSGCNKIRCVKCKSTSCYICQQIIEGYDHFADHRPPGERTASACRLWDHEEATKDAANVLRARDAAVLAQTERAAAEGVAIDAQDLAVEAPVPAVPFAVDDAYVRLLREMGPVQGEIYANHHRNLPIPAYNRGPLADVNGFPNIAGGPNNAIGANPFVPAHRQIPHVPAPIPYPPGRLPNIQPLRNPPIGAHLPFGPHAPDNIRAWMAGNPDYNPPLDPGGEAIINEFHGERERFRELREQMRILQGPPDIQAERRARRGLEVDANHLRRVERVAQRNQRAMEIDEVDLAV